MQKITPFLWFDSQAEEAFNFYASIFPDSKILHVSRCGEAGPGPAGSVMSMSFELLGQKFMALNGGPYYAGFSPSISFFVNCETQEEVDAYWDKLVEGGEAQRCGWLKDKFGLTWQIIPTVLGEYLGDPDPAKSQNVLKAMMEMVKLDIEGLKRAYAQH